MIADPHQDDDADRHPASSLGMRIRLLTLMRNRIRASQNSENYIGSAVRNGEFIRCYLGGHGELGVGRQAAVDDGHLLAEALQVAGHVVDVVLVEAHDAVPWLGVRQAPQRSVLNRNLLFFMNSRLRDML